MSKKHQIKRVNVKFIDDYSVKSLTPIFDELINETARVITDKWRGYNPLREKYNIEKN